MVTDNNSRLEKRALKEFFFFKVVFILRFLYGIRTDALLSPRMDICPMMSIKTGNVLYLAARGFLFG